MAQSGQVVILFKARENLLKHLHRQGYDVETKHLNMTEIHSILNDESKRLDFLLEHPTKKKFLKVVYHLPDNSNCGALNVDSYREKYFLENMEDENVAEEKKEKMLTSKDDLIILNCDEPNATSEAKMQKFWKQEKIYVVVINMERLQFDIMAHVLVPPHRTLGAEEDLEIRKKYNITEDSQLPEISRFSPVSQVIGIRPGQICEIIRPSKTAITTKYYRICSN
jgi:DNA-directed RNA polymerase subunit H (RpoH/RPB5)